MGPVVYQPVFRYETEQLVVHEPENPDHVWHLYRLKVVTDAIPTT